METKFVILFTMLLISACSSSLQVPEVTTTLSPTTTPNLTWTLTPSPKPTSAAAIAPTPTNIQLPYNLVQESSEYCQSPYAVLPIANADVLSEDTIVRKLVEIWLEPYKNPKAHPYCRIDDYRIDDIYSDPRLSFLSIQPKGDIVRLVRFSVKLIQVPNDWMSLSGEIDQENWLHTNHYISTSKLDDNYVMVFAYP
jgi:hypothetical protein